MRDQIDFSKLTKSQIDCMNYHAFGGYAGGKFGMAKTLAVLVEKGFLIPHEMQSRDALGVFKWIRYEMPIVVHMAWCAHVANDCDEEERR